MHPENRFQACRPYFFILTQQTSEWDLTQSCAVLVIRWIQSRFREISKDQKFYIWTCETWIQTWMRRLKNKGYASMSPCKGNYYELDQSASKLIYGCILFVSCVSYISMSNDHRWHERFREPEQNYVSVKRTAVVSPAIIFRCEQVDAQCRLFPCKHDPSAWLSKARIGCCGKKWTISGYWRSWLLKLSKYILFYS